MNSRGWRLNQVKAALSLIILLSSGTSVLADNALQDKSDYTLFNPVPDDLMRDFATDRPTKSASANTVDAGHFQYEADFVNWTYSDRSASMTSNIVIGDPTLKIGLTQNNDFEVALAPLNFNQTTTSAVHNTAAGFGDVYVRVKHNFIGNECGDFALALVPYVKAPTAAHNIGNNHWEGGAALLSTTALPWDWSMSLTNEFDEMENAMKNGTHSNFQNLINFGHPLFSDKITGFIEFWSDVNNDVDARTEYSLDFAAGWQLMDNLQLDAGINFGLNKATSDIQPYLGISQRF